MSFKKWFYSLSPDTSTKAIRYAVFALVLIASLVFSGIAQADLTGGGIGGQ